MESDASCRISYREKKKKKKHAMLCDARHGPLSHSIFHHQLRRPEFNLLVHLFGCPASLLMPWSCSSEAGVVAIAPEAYIR